MIYTPALIGVVGSTAGAAAVVVALTLRLPADVATVLGGWAVIFVTALSGTRLASPTHQRWGVDGVVQLGLTLTAGPVGGLAAAFGESLGVGVRTRNG